MTKSEIMSRQAIKYTNYASLVSIDAKTMSHMVHKLYLPACNAYLASLAKEVKLCAESGIKAPKSTIDLANKISALIDQTECLLVKMDDAIKNDTFSGKEKAVYARDTYLPLILALRKPVDELEDLVAKSYWPVPSYGDLLYHID